MYFAPCVCAFITVSFFLTPGTSGHMESPEHVWEHARGNKTIDGADQGWVEGRVGATGWLTSCIQGDKGFQNFQVPVFSHFPPVLSASLDWFHCHPLSSIMCSRCHCGLQYQLLAVPQHSWKWQKNDHIFAVYALWADGVPHCWPLCFYLSINLNLLPYVPTDTDCIKPCWGSAEEGKKIKIHRCLWCLRRLSVTK